MSDFWIYFNIGLKHVLSIAAFDHILFLLALTVAYEFKDWKRLLILISTFTLGHTLALFLSVFKVITVKAEYVEFLIPITILIAAVYNIVASAKKFKKDNVTFIAFVTIFFGIIHGLGFSNYFNNIIAGKPSDKLAPLLEFALGIEAAQITVVILTLLFGYFVQNMLKFSKRDWILIVSAFTIGVVLPLIVRNEIWRN